MYEALAALVLLLQASSAKRIYESGKDGVEQDRAKSEDELKLVVPARRV